MSLVHAFALIALTTAEWSYVRQANYWPSESLRDDIVTDKYKTCPPCETDDRETALNGTPITKNSLRCAPCALARAWIDYDDGAYQYNCVNAMSIALGEGAQPGSPFNYIKFGLGKEGDCPLGDRAKNTCVPDWGMSMEDFITDSRIFNLDQMPYDYKDNPDTLGPWQTKTANLTAGNSTTAMDLRISEAIGYAQSCCMDGTVSTGVSTDTQDKWCRGSKIKGNCEHKLDGACTHPYGFDKTHPISTVHNARMERTLDNTLVSSDVSWCGCKNGHSQTIGYSGRCSHSQDDFYTRYERLSWEICNHAIKLKQIEEKEAEEKEGDRRRRSIANIDIYAQHSPYAGANH